MELISLPALPGYGNVSRFCKKQTQKSSSLLPRNQGAGQGKSCRKEGAPLTVESQAEERCYALHTEIACMEEEG